jgi:CRISPR-associated protein Csx10
MMTETTIKYRLRLTAPALFPKNTGDPNNVDTWDHIPGSAILGCLAERWLEVARKDGEGAPANAAENPEFRRLFLDGRTCFLDVLPAAEPTGFKAMVPAPKSLFVRKGADDYSEIFDAAAQPDFPASTSVELVPADLGYVAWDGCTLSYRHRPHKQTDMHNQRNREKGRATRNEGAIFSYQAISPGEEFVGSILTGTTEDADCLQELLKKAQLCIGRSRKAQYGCMAELIDIKKGEWFDVQSNDEMDEPGYMVATLLSDYLPLEPAAGKTIFEALRRDVQGVLSCDLPAELLIEGKTCRYVRLALRRGYNNYWRMRRPLSMVIEAGSVLIFEKPRGIPVRLKLASVGGRRAEGFGRIALFWQGGESVDHLKRESYTPLPISPNDISAETSMLQEQMLEEWLRDRIPQFISRFRSNSDWPSRTAIGSLRTAWSLGKMESAKTLEEYVGRHVIESFGHCHIEVQELGESRSNLLDFLFRLVKNKEGATINDLGPDKDRPRFLCGVQFGEFASRRIVENLVSAILNHARREAKES